MVGILSAGAYSVGVKKDNYIKWNLDNNIPILGQAIHQTGWIKLTILSIDGDRITATYDSHFDPGISGTTPIDEKVTGYIDLSTGESNFPLSSTPILGRATGGLIVPAGLSGNDNIPGIGDVQGTETHEGRNAVYIVTPGVGTSIKTWWDQETGVMLETHFEFPYGSVTGSRTVKLTETNVWGGSFLGMDWWLYLVILVVIVAVVSVAAIAMQRRKSKVTTTPAPASAVTETPSFKYVGRHTESLSGPLAFALSCIVGVIFVVWFGQVGGWFTNNFTWSVGLLLSAIFGGWWVNGFALFVGLTIGIAVGFMVWALEKSLPVKVLEATISVPIGIMVTLVVGAILFALIFLFLAFVGFTWSTSYIQPSKEQTLMLQIITFLLCAAGVVIPFIAGGYAAVFVLALVDGIIEARTTPKQKETVTKREGSPEYARYCKNLGALVLQTSRSWCDSMNALIMVLVNFFCN